MIEIDGSHGEGGGQLLRMSIALSSITKKPVKIVNIRAKRPKPGLAAQHIAAIEAIVRLCSGEVKGLKKGSQVVEFCPSEIAGGKAALDVGTAGSVALVLQASLLPSLSASNPVDLRIKGGTDVKWSPPFDYFRNVFLPVIKKMGARANLELLRRGYYPRGGGEIDAHIEPIKAFRPLNILNKGRLKGIRGLAHVSNLPKTIAERVRAEAEKNLENSGRAEVDIAHYEGPKAVGQGGAVVLWAEFENTILGSSCLAERGLRAERVAQIACEGLKLEMDSNSTLDVYCSDQILPYMALAEGPSSFLVRTVSNHASTNMWLIEQFLDVKFSAEKQDNLWKVGAEKA